MDKQLVDLLSDPEVNEEVRKRSKVHAMEWLKKRVNRTLPPRVVYATFAYQNYRRGTPSFRLVFGSGQRLTAGQVTRRTLYGKPVTGRKAFQCNGVFSDSLAEALLAGYVAAELTDDPFDDTLI